MTRRTIATVSVIAILAPTLAGCAADFEEDAAHAVVSSSLEATRKQDGARQLAETVKEDCSLTAEQAAQEVVAAPVVGLYPASCVTKTANGADVHFQYQDCTGVFGQVDWNGGLDAGIEVTGECKLRGVLADSGDLTANGEPFDYSATADVVVRPGEREVTWNANWQGTTERGKPIEQTAQLHDLIDVASSCHDVSGSAQGKIDHTDYELAIDGVAVCPDTCPSGKVTAQWDGAFKEREVVVEFDGSDVAKVTGWSGRVFDVELVCTPVTPG